VELGGLPPTNVGVVGCHRGDPPPGWRACFVPRTYIRYSRALPNRVRSCRASDTTLWWGKQRMLAPHIADRVADIPARGRRNHAE
jgi:hypothetical protein